MHILDQIVAQKKTEIAEAKSIYPEALLEQSIYMESPTVSLSAYIRRKDKSGIIAEFKRKSPSKPAINLYADVEEVSMGYMQGGASALSVLTDSKFFGGSNSDLTIARKFNFCPILRKDFIIDEYQILEARSIGADAILLIAEILTKAEVVRLSSFAKSLGLEVLMELHSESQLSKYCETVDLIGVNNRDLSNFHTDIAFSKELVRKLPADAVRVSESGISTPQTLAELKALGYEGFLIGERFMTAPNPAEACMDFIKNIPA